MSQPWQSSFNGDDQVYAQVEEVVRLCLEAGQVPDVETLASQNPHLANEIRRMVPLVTTLHQLGHDREPIPPAAPTDRKPPRPLGRIGDYRILREIASGGMGIVYEAEHVETGDHVALKVLPFQQALDPRHVKRFKIGGYVAKQLQHRNIVPVFEVNRKRGVWYQVMHYVDGPSLATVIDRLRARVAAAGDLVEANTILTTVVQPARPEPRAAPSSADTAILSDQPSSPDEPRHPATYFHTVAYLGLQAAEALEYLHGLDHVHRDVKPANLLWERGRLWLTDFGLVRRPGQDDLTSPGELVGTLRYMSPEQVQGLRDQVHRGADIYGLGVTLYELLTLEPAFSEADPERLKYQIVHEEPRRLRRCNPAIPADLETVVLKAIAKSPAERYGTAQHLANDLRRFLNGQPVAAQRPTLWQRGLKKAARHQRALLVGLLAVTVTILSLSGAQYLRQQELSRQAKVHEVVANSLIDLSRHWGNDYLYRRLLAPDWQKEPRALVLDRLERMLEQEARLLSADGADAQSEIKRAVAVCNVYATFRYRLLGEEARALDCCRRALVLLTTLNPQPSSEPRLVCYLAAVHNELGQLHHQAGRHEEAESALRQAQAYLFPLVAQFSTLTPHDGATRQDQLHFIRYRYELATNLDELGNLLKKNIKRRDDAKAAFSQAIRLFTELAEQAALEADYHYDLAGALNNLGLLFSATGDFEQALKHHGMARTALLPLVNAHPKRAEFAGRLGQTLWQTATLYRDRNQLPVANDLLEEAVERLRKALKVEPNDAEYRTYLSQTFMELAATQVRLGRHSAAADTARQIEDQFHDDWQERYRSLAILAHCVELAENDPGLTAADRSGRAGDYAAQVRGHLRVLTEQGANDPAIQNELAWFLATCPALRLRAPAEAVALAKRAVAGTGDNARYWHTLGVACYRSGNWQAARQSLDRAAELRQGGTVSDWLFLAMTCQRLGEPERAQEYLARSARALAEHKSVTVELRRFWEEAVALVRPAPKPSP